jgi:hypothetical protein
MLMERPVRRKIQGFLIREDLLTRPERCIDMGCERSSILRQPSTLDQDSFEKGRNWTVVADAAPVASLASSKHFELPTEIRILCAEN